MAGGYVRVVAQAEDTGNENAAIVVNVADVAVGNRLVVCVSQDDQQIAGVADNGGNTWAMDKQHSGGFARVYSAHVASAPTTVTITKGAAPDRPTSYVILELSGVEAASAVRATGQSNGGNTSTWSSGASGSEPLAGDIAIGMYRTDGLTSSVTFDSPAQEVADLGAAAGGNATARQAVGYKLVSADGAVTIGGSRVQESFTVWTGVVVVYKGAAAAGGSKRRTLLGVGS